MKSGSVRDRVEAGDKGGRDLSRRLEAHAAAQHRQQGDRRRRCAKRRGSVPRPRIGDEFRAHRRKLNDERHSITHKFDIAGHEGYITVGMYEDGTPGEIFVSMSKQGSTISGLMDSFATAISYALQYGVPLQFLVDKFAHMRFEPSGFTKNPQIPYAKSIVDYLFRWLASKFLDEQAKQDVGIIGDAAGERPITRRSHGDNAPRLRWCRRSEPRGEPARGQGFGFAAGIYQSSRRAAVSRLRMHHGAQRRLLQMHELRRDQRMLVRRCGR